MGIFGYFARRRAADRSNHPSTNPQTAREGRAGYPVCSEQRGMLFEDLEPRVLMSASLLSSSTSNDPLLDNTSVIVQSPQPSNSGIASVRPGLLAGARTAPLAATVVPPESGVVTNVNSGIWTTVTLNQSFNSMVVVAIANYDQSSSPGVVRIDQAQGNSFNVTIAPTVTGQSITGVSIHYVVVEEGVYTQAQHGVTMEAVKFTSTVTDYATKSWRGESRSYANSYTNPVVMGQVMSANDPGWSAFWSHGKNRRHSASNSTLFVGKHVGEDPDRTRADETLGYIVIESGSGTLGGVSYVAGLGADSIRGVDNNPVPYTYALNTGFEPQVAVASVSAMDGAEGGWAVVYGSNPVSTSKLDLVIDEDQAKDNERGHTTEQVAYLILGTPTPPPTDTTAPVATLATSNITNPGGSVHTLTVTYSDDVAVDVSTLDSADVLVVSPGGLSQLATLVSVDLNTNGTPRTGTYQITAPGGAWDETDNGTYTVTMQAGQVSDTSGNPVAASTLGTFDVAIASSTFFDDMDFFDSTNWEKSDWWNGLPFQNTWNPANVTHDQGVMSLTFDDTGDVVPYASGEYRTLDYYGYGRLEGNLQAAQGDGLVTGLFTYTGAPFGDPWDEIDIEILGKNTTQLQVNYYVDGVGGHEAVIDLGFDAAAGFHTYAFDWTPTSITWYVDNQMVHEVTGSLGTLPNSPGRVFMNLWSCDAPNWCGTLNYTSPVQAQFDWVRFTPTA